MWSTDKDYFKDLESRCGGSKFAAVNYLAKQARINLKQVNNTILDSQALSWALTGKQPEIHPDRKSVGDDFITIKLNYLDELLCYVDDEEVCESVVDSFYESLEKRHLIYVYNNDLDESRKARVRILTRMIWDYNKYDE